MSDQYRRKSVEEQIAECTHSCNTCMANCEGGEGKLNKALDAIGDMEAEDLLKALADIAE